MLLRMFGLLPAGDEEDDTPPVQVSDEAYDCVFCQDGELIEAPDECGVCGSASAADVSQMYYGDD